MAIRLVFQRAWMVVAVHPYVEIIRKTRCSGREATMSAQAPSCGTASQGYDTNTY